MSDNTLSKSYARAQRGVSFALAVLIIFAIGWSQGELTATQRLADALQHVAPSTVQAVRAACPRELTREAGWSQSCLDLLPLTNFLPGEKE